MSVHIEWVKASEVDEVESHFMPGVFSDGFGTVNTGAAIGFAGVVIEGSIEELWDFIVKATVAVDVMEQDLLDLEDEVD